MLTALPRIVSILILAALITIGCYACTPAQKGEVKTVLDVSGALCEEAPTQLEPEWLQLTCSVIEGADGASKTFLAKVRRDDATAVAAMRARTTKCPACPSLPSAAPPGRVTP